MTEANLDWSPWGPALIALVQAYMNTPGAPTRTPERMAELAREVVVYLRRMCPDIEPQHLLPPAEPCEVYTELMRECGAAMVRIGEPAAEEATGGFGAPEDQK